MSGLLNRQEDATDRLMGAYAGHPMCGYAVGVDENGDEILEFTFPTQKEINAQSTPFFWACWDLYTKIKVFGLPHGRGWLHERPTVLRIHQILEAQKNRYESWRLNEGKNLEDRD